MKLDWQSDHFLIIRTQQLQNQWRQQETPVSYRHFFKLFANIVSYLSMLEQNEKLKFL